MALPWSFVSKITNPKHQITNKSQIQNRFNAHHRGLRRVSDCFFVWDFEFRSLLFVCFLGFVIWNFNKSMNFQYSKSPLGITKAWSSLRAVGPMGRRLGQDSLLAFGGIPCSTKERRGLVQVRGRSFLNIL